MQIGIRVALLLHWRGRPRLANGIHCNCMLNLHLSMAYPLCAHSQNEDNRMELAR